jgi:predicted RNase H-like HicB family nuclease
MAMGYAYTVLMEPWDDNGGFTVTVPALPGCITQGRTREEALERIREAIQCHIEGLEADGVPIPEERFVFDKVYFQESRQEA